MDFLRSCRRTAPAMLCWRRYFKKRITLCKRLWYEPPWSWAYWYRPSWGHGADEWCNPSVWFNLPLLGGFVIFWDLRRWREMPCLVDWRFMDDEERSWYLPGGYLEGGKFHKDRYKLWESTQDWNKR